MKDWLHAKTRRQFFDTCGVGLGKIALASLLGGDLAAKDRTNAFAPRSPMGNARAKRVIFLFMAGAPSQLELFDHKPKLAELDGTPIPPSVIAGQRYAFIQPDAAVLAPQFAFSRQGESGIELSDQIPHLAGVIDECTLVKSVHTTQFNHAPAQLFLNTGSPLPGRPAMGSWLSYGIGSLSADLPSFVVLKTGQTLSGGASLWSSGFLPGSHAGVPFREAGDPILHTSNPPGFDRRAQRDTLDLIQQLNRRNLNRTGHPDIETRIDSYEMAWRMQSAAPELTDLSGESRETLELYGIGEEGRQPGFARNCLLARRLVERGVRFVQVYHSGWDHHADVEKGIREQTTETDRASAALIRDLRRRGLLDDTLVIWGGEFGRTPMIEASETLKRTKGRDHHPQAFTMLFAGGGVKRGFTLGATDELGFHPTEDPVHVHDIQATILHLLGIDHERLTFRFQGRDFRLTDVHGKVVRQMIA